jgi:hypothetical protein
VNNYDGIFAGQKQTTYSISSRSRPLPLCLEHGYVTDPLQLLALSLATVERYDIQSSTTFFVVDLFSVHFYFFFICITVLDIPGLLDRTAFGGWFICGRFIFGFSASSERQKHQML